MKVVFCEYRENGAFYNKNLQTKNVPVEIFHKKFPIDQSRIFSCFLEILILVSTTSVKIALSNKVKIVLLQSIYPLPLSSPKPFVITNNRKNTLIPTLATRHSRLDNVTANTDQPANQFCGNFQFSIKYDIGSECGGWICDIFLVLR